jgi:hypothetical protein
MTDAEKGEIVKAKDAAEARTAFLKHQRRAKDAVAYAVHRRHLPAHDRAERKKA